MGYLIRYRNATVSAWRFMQYLRVPSKCAAKCIFMQAWKFSKISMQIMI